MKEKHVYRSPLREEQVKKTREQILEGLIKTMSRGVTELSIPAVAREAGVSVPTVYRHFRNKRELVEALSSYVIEKSGVASHLPHPPSSPEELTTVIRKMYTALDQQDETMRAVAVSELSNQMRKEAIPARLQMIERVLAPVKDRFNDDDWQRLRYMIFILSSSALFRAFKDYLDISAEEAADCVTWAILTLTHASSSPQKEQGSEEDDPSS